MLGLIMALRFRQVLENEWLLIISALLSVVFGVLLVLRPASGLLSVVWLVGLFALLYGVMLIVFGLRVRRLRR